MPKSTKTFILSNGRVNSNGFRVVTAGIDLSDFRKNPIMYWLHIYPSDKDMGKNQLLPIGFWDDIKIDGDNLTAVPNFDGSDDFAMKIYHKVEHGTLRAASVSIEPLQLDENKSNWLPGQTSATYVRSKIDEASIVDKPSNPDALALSYGSNVIYLNNQQQKKMAGSSSENSGNGNGEIKHPQEITDIMDNAVAAGKFTRSSADKLLNVTPNEPKFHKTLKEIVRQQPINPDQVQENCAPYFKKMAAAKSFDKIAEEDCACRQLAAAAPELYKAKFFEKNGRLPRVLPKPSLGNQ